MATTWDNLLETNDALMRRIAELERERDTIGAVLAEKSRNAVVSGGTPTLTERAANNRIAELEREREALRETIGQMEHEANTQHAAALDLQAQRDAAKAEATQQSEYIQSHGLTEFEMSRLQAELKAANKRIKKQLREIVELSKERERFALVIDSNKFPDTAAELIGQLRLDIVAAKERAEQAEADARALATLLKEVDDANPTMAYSVKAYWVIKKYLQP